jgi:hypothetical protein
MRTLLFLLSLSALSAASCTTFGANLPPGAAGGSFLDEARGTVPFSPSAATQRRLLDVAARAHVEAQIDVLVELRAQSEALRRDFVLAERELGATVEKNRGLKRADLVRVRDLARRYLELDALLYSLWVGYRDHLPHGSEPDPYAPLRAATMLSTSTREVGGLLSLAAEVVRLENAQSVVRVLEPRHALTRFLNRGDPELELPAEGFDRCVGALFDPDHRSLLERQLRAVEDERERLTSTTDRRVAFVLDTVQNSRLARAIIDETDGQRRLVFLWKIAERSALNAVGPALDGVIAAGYVDESEDPTPPSPPPPAPTAAPASSATSAPSTSAVVSPAP